MAFTVQAKLLLDGSSAKGELSAVRGEQDKLKTSSDGVTTSGGRMSRALDGVKTRLGAIRTRAATYIASLRDVQDGQRAAAGSAANLTAQFNDIGVMLAAGQNPLQLAIQQGTQITQVIGPMGAAGAARALGSAFIGMFNPISLITLGSIAAGAAMIQWLASAEEEARTLEEIIEDAAKAVEAFAKKADTARLSTADMLSEFGTASPELRAVLKDMAALAKIDAFKAIDETSASVRELVIDLGRIDMSSMGDAQDFLGIGSVGSQNREAGWQFAQNLDLLTSSQDMAVKYAAALDVREQLLATAGGIDGLNQRQRTFYEGLTTLIRDLSVFQKEEKDNAEAALAARREQMGYYAQSRSASNAELRTAEEKLQAMQAANALREAEILFGQDSAQAQQLQADAARDKLEADLAVMDVAESIKDEHRAALEAQLQMENADLASSLWDGVAAAEAFSQELWDAVSAKNQLAGPGAGGGRGGDPRQFENDPYWSDRYFPDPDNVKDKPKKRGGGASDYDREREAIARLMAREQERLEVLRATDPVMREMARIRDVLKNATNEERTAIEALIRERLREQGAIEGATEATDFFASNGMNALEAMALQGANTAEAWEQVRAALYRAAMQALVMGEGPLAKIFGMEGGIFDGLSGGGGGGGGVGGFIKDILGLKDGGYVTGTGGERSDQVPILGSPGEFMVNAPATRKHRHLLEAINAGADISRLGARGFANGGLIAPPVGAPPSAGLGGGFNGSASGPTQPALVRILPSPLFKAVVEETSQQTAVEVVEENNRTAVPGLARQAIDDPHRIG